jgi:hypothetical protein
VDSRFPTCKNENENENENEKWVRLFFIGVKIECKK